MVDDLQRLASAEAAALQLRLVARDLALAADTVADSLADALDAAGLVLERRLSEVHVRCDPLRIHEVTTNLQTNAMKFTPAGGWVVLETGPDDDPESGLACPMREPGRRSPPSGCGARRIRPRLTRTDRGRSTAGSRAAREPHRPGVILNSSPAGHSRRPSLTLCGRPGVSMVHPLRTMVMDGPSIHLVGMLGRLAEGYESWPGSDGAGTAWQPEGRACRRADPLRAGRSGRRRR